jgi:hypothetical protein
LKDLIRIANEGYSATWLCDFAEILTQAGELSLEIGTIPDDMNRDLRKLTKAQMVPSNRQRIARSLKHLIKFNNRMDKTVSVVEAPLADTVDESRGRIQLVGAVQRAGPSRPEVSDATYNRSGLLEEVAQGEFDEKSKPAKNRTQRRWP